MAQVRFLNRNRPNWLWAFSSVVVLLPLMLGQSSAGGCGAAVTVPNPDPNPGPNGNLNETILDSDGDGFPDDVEINSTPGTDPNDPTDNPNNVRDTDGDGCSDYDELNFPNFCDNDTYTSECQTTYYNTDFRFGFDLPPNAVLTPFDHDFSTFFGILWVFQFEAREMAVQSFVWVAPPTPLEEFVDDLHRQMQYTSLDEFSYVLEGGTEALFTAVLTSEGFTKYGVYWIANGFLYSLQTGFPDDAVPESADAYMIAILDSLCIN